jgi:tetratricopeptide (TPR) repeat protein
MKSIRSAVTAAVLLVLAVLLAAACGSPGGVGRLPAATPPVPPAVPARPTATPAPADATAAEISALRERLAAAPSDPAALRDLGLALLQRVRETADPSLYAQAEEALARARSIDPDDPLVLVGLGSIELGRHDFAAALETSETALALASSMPAAQAIRVDALVELGRYDEAVEAGSRLLSLRVDLASLARVSYLRELHGNLDGAIAAMEQAADVPATAPENAAYVRTLLGNLLTYGGRRAEAAGAYESALSTVPNHAAANAGLGRLAVGRGDYEEAIRRFEAASAVLPLPEYVIALGEAREAAGDADGAAEEYALARAETRLFGAAGVDVDLELALFEADHGDPARALDLAEAAYAARQTIRTADALAWASHAAGRAADAARLSERALALGTRDPLLRYHAGMIALSAGRTADARRLLGEALDLDPGFSATGARAARTALADLGGDEAAAESDVAR